MKSKIILTGGAAIYQSLSGVLSIHTPISVIWLKRTKSLKYLMFISKIITNICWKHVL